MKIFASAYEFDYSWSEVSTANWRKYCPWNKESSHVVAVDTLSRSIDPSTGVLRTERLITCRQGAPRWLNIFIGGNDLSHVYEVSYVTPPPAPTSSASRATPVSSESTPLLSEKLEKTPSTPPSHPPPRNPSVTMVSQNLTWSDLLSVRETCSYTPAPSDPEHRTRFEQHARIVALAGNWQRVKEKIESFTVERFCQNAEKGRAGFEEVLEMSRSAFGEERERRGRRGTATI